LIKKSKHVQSEKCPSKKRRGTSPLSLTGNDRIKSWCPTATTNNV